VVDIHVQLTTHVGQSVMIKQNRQWQITSSHFERFLYLIRTTSQRK